MIFFALLTGVVLAAIGFEMLGEKASESEEGYPECYRYYDW